MNDGQQRPPKRQIEIQREELATHTAQFLAKGGRIVELPLFVGQPSLVTPPMKTNLRSGVRSAGQKREDISRQVESLRRAGMTAGQIACQLGIDRRVAVRLIKARVNA
ncbi:hypothetical protein PS880_05902 [Pseudomonas fluorescens]|uniref:Uncharacterized protein n=2 Tax=Pseudomonas fluorescens TaxID=294 RepID=A0A5E7Q7Z1_PSEFL|nr:hypothetical protein PS880_05902 [Pseudomonas fluorescens]